MHSIKRQRWRIDAKGVIHLDFTLLNLCRWIIHVPPRGALAELAHRDDSAFAKLTNR